MGSTCSHCCISPAAISDSCPICSNLYFVVCTERTLALVPQWLNSQIALHGFNSHSLSWVGHGAASASTGNWEQFPNRWAVLWQQQCEDTGSGSPSTCLTSLCRALKFCCETWRQKEDGLLLETKVKWVSSWRLKLAAGPMPAHWGFLITVSPCFKAKQFRLGIWAITAVYWWRQLCSTPPAEMLHPRYHSAYIMLHPDYCNYLIPSFPVCWAFCRYPSTTCLSP